MRRVFEASYSRNTTLWGLVFSIAIGVLFASIAFFSSKGPIVFSISMLSIAAVIMVFMLYLTLAGRRMRYELGDSEFKVNFGPMKFRAPYSAITNVQVSPVRLLLRLFGGSWPGLHWGIFKADVGRVNVYSTRRTGNLVLMSLADGKKVVLSPEEPEKFLAEMNARIRRSLEPSSDEIGLFETSKKAVYAQVLVVCLAYLLLVAYVLTVYPSLPEVIPVHFDFNWNPNRWAHKTELFIITGVAAMFPAVNAILALKFGKYGKHILFFFGAIFVATIALFFGAIQTTVELSPPLG